MSDPASPTPRQWRLLAVIAFGGIIGALARWGLMLALGDRAPGAWPWATFAENIIGCLVIGIVASLLPMEHGVWWHRPLLITGVLGGFTTFSAYAVETGALLDEGAPLIAGAYLSGTVVAGLVAVRTGRWIAGWRRGATA